jgi:hypothetical protein
MALDPIDFFYRDGTVTLTNGSDIMQGTFTAWDPAVLPYDWIVIKGGANEVSIVKEVLAVDQIRLPEPWAGPTLTNVPYYIVRWIKHTDPRIYGVRVSDYLTRLKAIPDNIEQVAGEINADRQVVEAAMVTLAGVEAAVDADRQAVATDRAAVEASASAAADSAEEAEQWAQAASTTVLPDNSVTNTKLADMASARLKGRVTAGSGDPEDLTADQVSTILGVRLAGHGGIEIYRADGNNLGIRPRAGGRLIVNGESLPVVATTKSITSVTNDVASYVFAYKNGTVLDYEFANATTTSRATHTDGVEIKSGDPSRTLIGIIFKSSAFGFVDTPQYRLVANWFHRRPRSLNIATANASVTATTLTAISTGFFVCWTGDDIEFLQSGHAYSNGGAAGVIGSGIISDTTQVGAEALSQVYAVNHYYAQATVGSREYTTDGLHSAQIAARAAGIPSFQLTQNLTVRLFI